jgi:AAA15 family ATPase/GTPase
MLFYSSNRKYKIIMIVLFSVANFRSFSSEETFSLVASKQLSTTHQTHLIPIPDTTAQVLKTSVLYGANGAGKSN